jgi:transcriptional regulator with XRE-family HTH domain
MVVAAAPPPRIRHFIRRDTWEIRAGRHPVAVDLGRAGRSLREIRRHKGWTLERAAAEADLSRATAGRIEAGRHDSARALTAYARGLGADVSIYVRWHGGDLDRLLNRRHAAMHEQMARLWPGLPSWTAVPEVTFSVFGERGVVDWVAWHAETGTLLLVELKTELVDINDLLSTANRRTRLARQIAEPYGWAPRRVAYWLAIEDDRTNRRHLTRYSTVLRSAFPDDGHTIRRWLREPDRPLRCLSFMTIAQPERRRHPRATAERSLP